jgi:tight adherence protein C
MSSAVFLSLGLLATFSAIIVGGFALEAALSERRRSVDLLRSQVGEVNKNLRDQELAEPFLERVIVPVVSTLGKAGRRITPLGMRDRIARKLVLAGSPPGLDAEKVAAFKIFGAVGGGVFGIVVAAISGFSASFTLEVAAFLAAFGFLLPGAGLGQRAIHRQETIQKALPDSMDLLTISVEAGLGFDAALAHVRRNVPGPLSDEFGRMLQEMQLGVSRVDAFRHLSDRTDVDELRAFVLAMIQADVFGVSIAKVLRAQAKELRVKRRQRAEEKAQKLPVKLLFPLLFGILPSMFVVIVGPGVIRMLHSFLGINP